MPKSKYLLRFALLTRLVKSRPGISFQEIQRDVVKNLQILNERDGKHLQDIRKGVSSAI